MENKDHKAKVPSSGKQDETGAGGAARTSRGTTVASATIKVGGPPDLSGEAKPGLETQKREAVAARDAMLAAGRPEEAARAAAAAAGSAVDAPDVGSGPAGIRAFPGDPLVSLGGDVVARDHRRLALSEQVRRAPITGSKLAITLPDDPDHLADCREAGFDLVVTARRANFRRAGVMHPEEATLRRSRDFTHSELESLKREPALIVRALD